MSGLTIDLLASGAALVGTEKIPMLQGGAPAVSTTPAALRTYLQNNPTGRIPLTTNTTFYVNGSSSLTANCNGQTAQPGNDSNSGLSLAAPFLTLQKAINVISDTYDLAGFQVTIQLSDAAAASAAAANYVGAVTGALIGGLGVVINGNTSTPSNVNITAPNGGFGITANDYAVVFLQNLQINDAGSATGAVTAIEYGIVDVQAGVFFGAFNNAATLMVANRGNVNIKTGTCTVTGNAGGLVMAERSGAVRVNSAHIAIPNAITFAIATAKAIQGGRLLAFSASVFTNAGGVGSPASVTGQRAILDTNSSAELNGSSINSVFPGSAPASIANFSSTDFGDALTVGGCVPITLGQSHIPFVLVSSGTMGNNGALSGVTALPTTYPNAYVWMPAGAIASGSAAGWYYAQFSSATAATVFNNTYTSGTPQIPATPTPFVTTGPGAYTQTTGSNIAAYALAIPGNTIGINGSVQINAQRSANTTSGNKTFSGAYGSFTFFSFVSTTIQSVGYLSGLSNRGVANVQVAMQNALGTTGSGTGGTVTYGAVDSTTAQNLVIDMQLATATDTRTLDNIVVQLIPGVP